MVTAIGEHIDGNKIFEPAFVDVILDEMLGSESDWQNWKEKDIPERIKAKELTRRYVLAWYRDTGKEEEETVNQVQDNAFLFYLGALAALTGEVSLV